MKCRTKNRQPPADVFKKHITETSRRKNTTAPRNSEAAAPTPAIKKDKCTGTDQNQGQFKHPNIINRTSPLTFATQSVSFTGGVESAFLPGNGV